MNTHSILRSSLVIASANLLCGCASIISGRHATVEIDSSPSAAEVVIRDQHGNEVLTTHTPAKVQLKRKDKFIWPAKYTATFEKPGYEPKTVAINSKLNPWILGNVVFGGVIGLAVDNATGAAWQPKVASIDASLSPLTNEPIATAQLPISPNSPPYSSSQEQDVQPATAVY